MWISRVCHIACRHNSSLINCGLSEGKILTGYLPGFTLNVVFCLETSDIAITHFTASLCAASWCVCVTPTLPYGLILPAASRCSAACHVPRLRCIWTCASSHLCCHLSFSAPHALWNMIMQRLHQCWQYITVRKCSRRQAAHSGLTLRSC